MSRAPNERPEAVAGTSDQSVMRSCARRHSRSWSWSSNNVLVTISVKPLGWGVVLGAAVLGSVAVAAGIRVWRGAPINPRNTLETEDKLAVLSVTLLPTSIMFLCWAAIGLVSEAGSGAKGTVAVILILVELVLGLVSLLAFLVAASLFFFSRPRRFVPPHLRRPPS